MFVRNVLTNCKAAEQIETDRMVDSIITAVDTVRLAGDMKREENV